MAIPLILQIILFIIQAIPSVIKAVIEIWALIRKQPNKFARQAAKERLFKILLKAKQAKFVSSTQASELEQLLAELKAAQ